MIEDVDEVNLAQMTEAVLLDGYDSFKSSSTASTAATHGSPARRTDPRARLTTDCHGWRRSAGTARLRLAAPSAAPKRAGSGQAAAGDDRGLASRRR